MKIFLLLLLSVTLSMGDKYDELKKYKENSNNHIRKSANRFTPPLQVENKYKNYIEITYHDINNMDTDLLEKKYYIYLWLCLADGICVFKAKEDQNIEILIQKIKSEEPDINTVKQYSRFEFQPL